MDEFYNERAARWVRETVMKMDDDAVKPFVTMVAHGLLHEHIQGNRRTLDRRVAEIQKNLMTVAKRSPSGGVLVPVIEQVSKNQWDENKVKRDKGGQFSRTESRVRTNQNSPAMRKKEERAAGVPSAKGLATATGSVRASQKLTPQQRSAYQQQYQQIADRLDEATSRGATSIDVVLQDKRTGRRNTRSGINNLDWVDWWNPGTHDAVSVRYNAPGTDAGAATFDLVSALGGSNQAAARASEGVSNLDERGGRGASSFQRQWNDSSRDTPGTNDRTYRRIAAGSKLVGNIPNEKARAASALGEFVGSFGPEAEKVVGPHMRRTAYRYRGTERKPDETLIDLANKMAERAGMTRGDGSVGQIAADRATGASRLTPEQKINIAEQTAMLYFLGSERNGLKSRLPDNTLSELHRQSGKIPPSEGIIIDRDGEIVTQAVGFAEDHYLPFNLKNLKNLDGGTYVRTRSRGGLSTEDIYTGLVSGAREVTVVSNSGTFTIEFSPDFRGVRRYNDKAAQMVERYAKTLDAIKSGQVERDKIDASTRAELRAEVESQMPREMGYTEAEISAAIREREADFKRNPQPTLAEIQEIKAKAAEAAGGNEREQRIYEAQLMEDLMEERRDRFYKLDGEGYATALRALQEQFPYYIQDISFMSRRQQKKFREEPTDPRDPANEPMLRFNNSPDTGYVAPRHNRPAAVQEGYYDESITGTGKIPASQTNYQNWENNPQNRRRGGVQEDAQEPQSAEGVPTPQQGAESAPQGQAGPQRPNPQVDARRAVQAAQQDAAYASAMRNTLDQFSAFTDVSDVPKGDIITEARQDWDAVANDPAKMMTLEEALENLQQRAATGNDTAQSIAEAGKKSLEEARLLKEAASRISDTQKFDGVAYQPGAPAETARSERQRWANVAQQAGFPMPDDPTKVDSYRRGAGAIAQILRGEDGEDSRTQLASQAARMGLSPDAAINLIARSASPVGRQTLLERMTTVADAAARIQALGEVPDTDAPAAPEPARVENTPQMSTEDLMGMSGQPQAQPAARGNDGHYNQRVLGMNLANHYATQSSDDEASAYWQDLSLALDNEVPDPEGVRMATEGLMGFPLNDEQQRMINSLRQEFGGRGN